MLEQEYEMRSKMDNFEMKSRQLVQKLQTFSLIEFFHEEHAMSNQIEHLKHGLDDFNIYLPQTAVIIKDLKKAEKEIMVDMRERLNGYITRLNHDFALKNYEYIQTEVADKTVRDIYKVLGPFDHFTHKDLDDDLDMQRMLKMDFEDRRSGAKYRGQINLETFKPDGMGFKIYPNDSVFEGFYEEGQINGYGRGITSRGEVYQGPFVYNVMEGEGLYQWPDGRLYYGSFHLGKKHGTGTYMWPNG